MVVHVFTNYQQSSRRLVYFDSCQSDLEFDSPEHLGRQHFPTRSTQFLVIIRRRCSLFKPNRRIIADAFGLVHRRRAFGVCELFEAWPKDQSITLPISNGNGAHWIGLLHWRSLTFNYVFYCERGNRSSETLTRRQRKETGDTAANQKVMSPLLRSVRIYRPINWQMAVKSNAHYISKSHLPIIVVLLGKIWNVIINTNRPFISDSSKNE